MKMINWS